MQRGCKSKRCNLYNKPGAGMLTKAEAPKYPVLNVVKSNIQ